MQKPMLIDCHGYYTTAPRAREARRAKQIANLDTPALINTKSTKAMPGVYSRAWTPH